MKLTETQSIGYKHDGLTLAVENNSEVKSVLLFLCEVAKNHGRSGIIFFRNLSLNFRHIAAV